MLESKELDESSGTTGPERVGEGGVEKRMVFCRISTDFYQQVEYLAKDVKMQSLTSFVIEALREHVKRVREEEGVR